MFGLPIISYSDLQQWELDGNFKDYLLGIPKCPSNYLLCFYYFGAGLQKNANTPTITGFTIKKIRILNGKKTVISTTALTASSVKLVLGTNYHQFYFIADGTEHPTLSDGVYEFFIEVTQGTKFEFKSEPFLYCYNKYPYGVTGDYDIADFTEIDFVAS